VSVISRNYEINQLNENVKRYCLVIVFLCCHFLVAQIAKDTSAVLDISLYKLKAELEAATLKSNAADIAKANLRLGDFFNHLKLYTEATKHYQAFLETHTSKDSLLVNVQNTLAGINLNLNKYEDAQHHALIGKHTSIELKYLKGQASSNLLLGSVAEKLGDYDEALDFQTESLSIFKTLNDSTGLAKTNENIGSIYEDLEQYNLAYTYFLTASRYAKNSDTDLQINITNNLGDIYRKTENYDEALVYTQNALQIAKTTNNETQQVSALKDMAKIYAALGNFEKAYTYLNNQRIASEDALVRNNMQLISAMEVMYGVRERKAEVELLNKQNQINKVRQQVIIIIASAVVLAFGLGLLYWIKRRKHEKHIFEYKQQLLQADLEKKTAEEQALNREIDIKISSLTNYSLHLAHKNKMLSDVSKTLSKLRGRQSDLVNKKLKELITHIELDINKNNEWTELMGYFSQIHPSFFKTLKNVASQKLSSSEMRLSMLLKLNLSSKEIAEILNITSDSVRIARYRLRKKLPLHSKEDLQGYLLNL